jgi:hypothetical protein
MRDKLGRACLAAQMIDEIMGHEMGTLSHAGTPPGISYAWSVVVLIVFASPPLRDRYKNRRRYARFANPADVKAHASSIVECQRGRTPV